MILHEFQFCNLKALYIQKIHCPQISRLLGTIFTFIMDVTILFSFPEFLEILLLLSGPKEKIRDDLICVYRANSSKDVYLEKFGNTSESF